MTTHEPTERRFDNTSSRLNENAAKVRRVIAYLRVSTDQQADDGISIKVQRAKVDAYANLYDLDLVDVVEDVGCSGKSLDRPGLVSALARLDRGEADGLLVVKLDRLTRSVRDLGALVERCERRGWRLLSVGEHIDTDTASGRLVLNVLAAVAQWEREAIGERTAAALAWKRARGEYTGGEPPYGLRVSDDGVRLEEDAREQAVIARAVELRATGLSLRAVGAHLAAEGLLPRGEGRWHAETVAGLLNADKATQTDER